MTKAEKSAILEFLLTTDLDTSEMLALAKSALLASAFDLKEGGGEYGEELGEKRLRAWYSLPQYI